MKNFLAFFLGAPGSAKFNEFMAMEEGKRKKIEAQGIQAWGDWMKNHSAVIVDTGGPLGKTKKASAQGISDTKNNLSGFVVIQHFPRRLGRDHGSAADSGSAATLACWKVRTVRPP